MKIHETVRPKIKYLQLYIGNPLGEPGFDWRWITPKDVLHEIDIYTQAKHKYITKILEITDKNLIFDETLAPRQYKMWKIKNGKLIV